jgi:hypothetical protein
MAAYNKFEPFVEALAEQAHDLGADQLTVALTNASNAPVATDGDLSDLTEIAYTNLSSRNVTTASSAQTSGTYKLTCTDLTLSASGGAVAAFRYVVLYNSAAASADTDLIGFWDYGSEVTLNDGDSFQIDFDDANGVLTIA